MTWVLVVTGVVGIAVACVLRYYLVVRVRQMDTAVYQLREFQSVATDLLQNNIPDFAREQLVDLINMVGEGRLARKLFKRLANGDLSSPITRAEVTDRRDQWDGFSRDIRIKFTTAVYAGILADSYYAGLVGTALRRSLLSLTNDATEVAESIDAFETRVLIVGTAQIGHKAAEQRKPSHGMVNAC